MVKIGAKATAHACLTIFPIAVLRRRAMFGVTLGMIAELRSSQARRSDVDAAHAAALAPDDSELRLKFSSHGAVTR